jgi:uracil-DNA glycosylase
MEEFVAKKLYKGKVSLRSYDVDKWVENRSSVKVSVVEHGFMILTPEQLSQPISISTNIPSSFNDSIYQLYDYTWIPEVNDKDKVIIAQIGPEWYKQLKQEFNMDYMKRLAGFIAERRKTVKIYPSSPNVFKALKLTQYSNVRVCILGQDPYPDGSADGLAFSCSGPRTPKSLQIIFEELAMEASFDNNSVTHFNKKRDANLEDWASQGVLLLNTILTVEENSPLSHKGKGWEIFTEKVIKSLNAHPNPIAFVLWGSGAKEYKKLIDNDYHLVLEAAHPAAEFYNPGNGGFLKNYHFTKINSFLNLMYNEKIKW